jgi:hypothetical protein
VAGSPLSSRDVYGRGPLSFEANLGQAGDPDVTFLARRRGYRIALAPTRVTLALKRPGAQGPGATLRMILEGASPSPQVQASEELPGKVNYFLGDDPDKWRRNIPTYARVRYSQVYRGVDLVWYGNQRRLEYDFVVAPGADPKQISLAVEGADDVRINSRGDLVVRTGDQEIRNRRPLIYQTIRGVRRQIRGGYRVQPNRRVTFQVARYDTTTPLVIDPELDYSTYLGGSGDDQGFGVAVDSAGNAYFTGQAWDGTNYDAFVTKLNPVGSIVYSTFVGGSAYDFGAAIAVDTLGSAYITGLTYSYVPKNGANDFPKVNALISSFTGNPNGSYHAFVTKLNADGDGLLFSTYLGGN